MAVVGIKTYSALRSLCVLVPVSQISNPAVSQFKRKHIQLLKSVSNCQMHIKVCILIVKICNNMTLKNKKTLASKWKY